MDAIIRLAGEVDAAPVCEIYAPFVDDTAVSFEREPPSAEEMRRRITSTLSSHPWLVYDRAGEIIGYAYATRHRKRAAYEWSVETSVYVRDGFRRSGVGRALYRSLLAVLVLQGYYNAYAGIALPNPASVALHEAVGFRRLGVYNGVGYKMGAWHDVGWWQRELRAKTGSPSRPVSIDEVQALDGWPAALAEGQRSD